MRLAAVAVVLALAAACGGSSAQQTLSVPPTSSTPGELEFSPVPTTVATTGTVVAEPAPAGSATAGVAQASAATQAPLQQASVTPPGTPPTATDGTVSVGNDDSGRTVTLAVGQRLHVRLDNGTWDPPVSSSDAVVVRRSSTGGYPSNEPVDATFAAIGRGRAEVTAQSDAACFHTNPRCMMASRQWQLTVVVR
jgi:hypothetical protein